MRTSRVSNCDTNLVKEPVIEPVCAADATPHILEAFGQFWNFYPRPRNEKRSKFLFVQAVKKGTESECIVQSAEAYASENEGNRRQFIAYSDNWLENERWKDQATKKLPNAENKDVAAYWAKSISDGKFIPSTAITDRVAVEMIQRNLVSLADLAAVGVRM